MGGQVPEKKLCLFPRTDRPIGPITILTQIKFRPLEFLKLGPGPRPPWSLSEQLSEAIPRLLNGF